MSHTIGTGTANINVNTPIDEKAEIGRLAFRRGFKSVGDCVRHMMLRGIELEDAESAERIRNIRAAYYGAIQLAIFLAALIWCHEDLRRPARRVRTRPVEECVEEMA